MATTVSALILAGLPASEELDAAVLTGLANRSIQHDALTAKIQLNATSTPPVSLISTIRLTAASGTIDLTTLPTTEGTRSASGLKLIAIYARVSTAHALTIAVGASNGYVIGGHTLRAEASGLLLHYFAVALAAVGGSTKNLDYTFNAAGTADLVLLFG